MKYLPLLLFFSVGQFSCSQDKTLIQYKKHFDQELKQWTGTFNNFNLSAFDMLNTAPFENNLEQNLDHLNTFLSIHKPIISFSPDSSKFIDIYSYQLNLEKKGDHYYANPDIDQAIFLYNPQKKYWNKIYFGTSSQWIDEVLWLSSTKFILVGILKSTHQKRIPLILLGDTDNQTLVSYVSNNKDCFQNDHGYSSPKLKRINIEGL